MNIKTAFRSHWVTFLILVPSLILFCVHEFLGLSHAALLIRDQRDRDSQLFNFVMVFVFLWSLYAAVAHATYTLDRGIKWFLIKIAVLIVYYLSVPCFFYIHSDA